MKRLTPLSFSSLLRRMKQEVEMSQAIFDLPARSWFTPPRGLDFSARHFSHPASTPLGPAAGPHTQLAQNIVLSWLAGARILELKTVQVNDHLEIPRPCIHIPNVGYNVEWSQELSISESLLEYAKAVYLIEILKHTGAFGVFAHAPRAGVGSDTVFDISVGYDLQGIRSEKVTAFLKAVRCPAPHFNELRRELDGEDVEIRDLAWPTEISDSVTLSTFHGCPAGQIEAMVRYLLEVLGFNVIVKFNPTLLGFENVRDLLIEQLGYRHLELSREAFDQDLQYGDALEMMRRLNATARECGRGVGAKLTNTLVVANNPAYFPTQPEPYMYLSGQPLHVLAMNLMQRFREDLGCEIPLSFSAGIERKNFPAAVACGLVPVTTCTDLLRQGGYARLPRYLSSLGDEFQRHHVTSREAFVLAARGHGAEAVREALTSTGGGLQVWEHEGRRLSAVATKQPDDLPPVLRETARAGGLDAEEVLLLATRIAGRMNGREIVPRLAGDPRYHARSNQKEPPRIERGLSLYDCINCDLCISACPNDAVFAYEVAPVAVRTERFHLRAGNRVTREPGSAYTIGKAHQLAVVEDICNECSNCDLYCPQEGAPYKLKEHVFATLENYWAAAPGEGFCRRGNVLYARIAGNEWIFEPSPGGNGAAVFCQGLRLEVQWTPFCVGEIHASDLEERSFDTALLWRMKTVWESIFHSSKPNAVNPDPLVQRRSKPAPEVAPAGGGR